MRGIKPRASEFSNADQNFGRPLFCGLALQHPFCATPTKMSNDNVASHGDSEMMDVDSGSAKQRL